MNSVRTVTIIFYTVPYSLKIQTGYSIRYHIPSAYIHIKYTLRYLIQAMMQYQLCRNTKIMLQYHPHHTAGNKICRQEATRQHVPPAIGGNEQGNEENKRSVKPYTPT